MAKKYSSTRQDLIGDSVEKWSKTHLECYGFDIEDDESYTHPTYDFKDKTYKICFEVKGDTNAIKTDNLFFEVWDDYPNKKGNLAVSEAIIWIYNILDWDSSLNEYIPVFTFYIDIDSLKEYLKKKYNSKNKILRKQKKYQNNKIVTQGYFLVKFEEIVPFIIDPKKLDDFLFGKTISGVISPECYMCNNNQEHELIAG